MTFTETMMNLLASATAPINQSLNSQPFLRFLRIPLLLILAFAIQYFVIKWEFNTKFRILRKTFITLLIFLGLVLLFPGGST